MIWRPSWIWWPSWSTDKITCYVPKYHYTKNGAFIRSVSVTVIPLSHSTINRCEEIVTEEEDRKEERKTIENALNIYAAIQTGQSHARVEENLRNKEENKGKGNSRKESSEKNKGMVVLPYVRAS